MNPDKKKIGCLVPHCEHEWCDRKKKKFCALRKYYLLDIKAKRSILFSSSSEEVIEIMRAKLRVKR